MSFKCGDSVIIRHKILRTKVRVPNTLWAYEKKWEKIPPHRDGSITGLVVIFIGKTTLSNGIAEYFLEEGTTYTTKEVLKGAWVWDGRKPFKVLMEDVKGVNGETDGYPDSTR